MSKLSFPEGFLWGTSTSAYQVEGGNVNDWSQWEKSGERMLKITKSHQNPGDFICGKACDSYHRYQEDFDMAKALNTNTIRISVEWSRLEPSEGTWDVNEVKHYYNVLKEAQKHGFKVMLCLWHWTNPVWLERKKGWTSVDVLESFKKYVELVVSEYGGMVDYWLVLNEPLVPNAFGYLLGEHPPGKKGHLFSFNKMKANLVKAHIEAYNIIHKNFPNSMVGSSMLSNYMAPASPQNVLDVLVARIARYFINDWFLKDILKYSDFLGMQYYRRTRVSAIPPFVRRAKLTRNDMGWEVYPEGLYKNLMHWKKYKKPIIITENGTADEKDLIRAQFIKEHLASVHRAIKDGVDVRGYYHWSLLDNFEWAYGWAPKFGLYELDRTTQNRHMRPSAVRYAEICENNSVDV